MASLSDIANSNAGPQGDQGAPGDQGADGAVGPEGPAVGVQDTPVDGATTAAPSSNWAFDHAADTAAHGGPYNNYSHPDHTGDVGSTGDGATVIGALKVATGMIQDDAVTYPKIQNVAAAERILGRATGAGVGVVQELTAAQVNTILGTPSGVLLAAGTVPLTANWDVGAFTVTMLSLKTNTISEETAAAGVTIDGVLHKDGQITSTGIDDNCTVTTLTLTDNTSTTGPNGHSHLLTTNNNARWISASTSTTLGSNITLWGSTHALANDFRYRASGNIELYYDDSASSWDFQANAITTTGFLTTDHITESAGQLRVSEPVYFVERAAAGADTATLGQLWVKNTNPQELYFTDDDSVEHLLNTTTVAELDSTPPSDNTFDGPSSTVTVTGSPTFGQLLYKNSTNNTYAKTDADSFTTMPCYAISGGGSVVLLPGTYIRDTAWSWTAGNQLYVGNAIGSIVSSPPSGSGDIIQVIGHAVTSDVIFFSPSADWFENL
jgi:hypothetical protein